MKENPGTSVPFNTLNGYVGGGYQGMRVSPCGIIP